MHFNPDITFGNILTILSVMVGAIWWVSKMTISVESLKISVERYAKLLEDFMEDSAADRQDIHRQLDTLARQKRVRDKK